MPQRENPIPIPQRFAVTLEEAGYLMGVSAQTMRDYVRAGLIRPLRPNKSSIRLRVKDVEELVDKMVGKTFDSKTKTLKRCEELNECEKEN